MEPEGPKYSYRIKQTARKSTGGIPPRPDIWDNPRPRRVYPTARKSTTPGTPIAITKMTRKNSGDQVKIEPQDKDGDKEN